MQKNILFALLLLFSPVVSAVEITELPHSYISIGHVEREADGEDASGLGIDVAVDLGSRTLLLARYSDAEAASNDEIKEKSLGFGFYQPATSYMDFVGAINLERVEYSRDGSSESGYSFDLGLRSLISEYAEMSGKFSYLKLADGAGDTVFTFGLAVSVADGVALTLSTDLGGVNDGTLLGFRLSL